MCCRAADTDVVLVPLTPSTNVLDGALDFPELNKDRFERVRVLVLHKYIRISMYKKAA